MLSRLDVKGSELGDEMVTAALADIKRYGVRNPERYARSLIPGPE